MKLALAQSYKDIAQQELNKVLASRPLLVAGLGRVSTSKEEQKSSLENQKLLYKQICAENGWELYDVYEEVESGTHSNRKGLNELINDAKEHKFDLILAKELSRLARNVPLAYQLKDILNKHKIHLKTLDGAIDTLNGDQKMFGLFAWIYEQESQKISDRIKRTFRTRANEGEFNGSIPPYGYFVKDKKLFIKDDGTSEVVRRIYREYIEGKGFDAIARDLYNEGITTPSQINERNNAGDKWHGSTVKKILMNPHYTGSLVQCRDTKPEITASRQLVPISNFIIVENTHKAIISLETFNTVQELIISRRRIRPQQEIHLFTNTLFCADCGRGMHYKKNRKGYVCGNYNKHGIKACSEHFIKEHHLEDIILHDIKSSISELNLAEYLKQSIKERVNNNSSTVRDRLKQINLTIDKLNKRIINLTTQYLDDKDNTENPTITKEVYKMTLEAINNEINALVTEKIDIENAIQNKTHIDIDNIKEEIFGMLPFNNLSSELLHRFVSRVEIKADGSLKIFYRF